MVSAGDFRNGITVEMEGNVFQIIEFQHVKPGKGAAFVRTKTSSMAVWWRRASVPLRNSLRHVLTERTCSICILMETCSISWTWRPMTRLH